MDKEHLYSMTEVKGELLSDQEGLVDSTSEAIAAPLCLLELSVNSLCLAVVAKRRDAPDASIKSGQPVSVSTSKR